MTRLRSNPFIISVNCFIFLFIQIFIIGCGDEGEKLDIMNPRVDEQPGDSLPPGDVSLPDVQNPPPADEPPVETPRQDPPPEESPVENPPAEEPPAEEPPEEPPLPEPKVSFADDLLPILNANCNFPGCHAANPPSGLQLTTFANLQRGGNSGPAFTPNNSGNSLIIRRIDGGGMPLGGAPLPQAQIQLFVDWIDKGGLDN